MKKIIQVVILCLFLIGCSGEEVSDRESNTDPLALIGDWDMRSLERDSNTIEFLTGGLYVQEDVLDGYVYGVEGLGGCNFDADWTASNGVWNITVVSSDNEDIMPLGLIQVDYTLYGGDLTVKYWVTINGTDYYFVERFKRL